MSTFELLCRLVEDVTSTACSATDAARVSCSAGADIPLSHRLVGEGRRSERQLPPRHVTLGVGNPHEFTPSFQPNVSLASQYVYDVGEKSEAGVTWYDVASDVVGPDSAPPLVRHRMRLAARRLTRKPPGALRVLLDILEAASS